VSQHADTRLVRLGDLTSLISSGSTPKGGSEVYLREGPVMLIRSQNVLMNQLALDDVAYVTNEIDATMNRSRVRAGDVLLNITGASIGRVTAFELQNIRANVNQHVCVIRPKSDILIGRYLAHLLCSPEFQAEIDRVQHGGTRQALTFSQIAEFQIPLLPLAEQHRISGILDKADALRAKRSAAIAQLDSLPRSIFLELFGDPVFNPKGWSRVSFRDLLVNIDSGWSPTCLDRAASAEEWGVLKLGAVTWCEYDDAENKALPANVAPATHLEVKQGDLLFTRKNTYDLVAACALVRNTRPRLMMSDLIFRFRLRPDAEIDPCFLHQLLIYPSKRNQIQKLAGGSAGSMPNISKARLEGISIELPPLALQKDLRRFLDSVENLKKNNRAALSEKEELFCSLRSRAFRGEL
jgi:type I restriction enzyme S subunit